MYSSLLLYSVLCIMFNMAMTFFSDRRIGRINDVITCLMMTQTSEYIYTNMHKIIVWH